LLFSFKNEYNLGMTPFQALFYNYMSGNAAYLGCIIGIRFGQDIRAARWIFSISGATSIKITLIQILGVICGMGIIIFLNIEETLLEF
jgi:hypothetical protein